MVQRVEEWMEDDDMVHEESVVEPPLLLPIPSTETEAKKKSYKQVCVKDKEIEEGGG